jgi:hypothetical protein
MGHHTGGTRVLVCRCQNFHGLPFSFEKIKEKARNFKI